MVSLTQISLSQWSYHGLSGKTVSALEYHNGYLYAGTDDGLYEKPEYSNDTVWTNLGLNSKLINSILIFNDTTYMVSIDVYHSADTASIYKTFDGGDNWLDYQHNFGGGESVIVWDFAMHNETPDTIFAAGETVAKSTDRGLTWSRVYGNHWVLADYHIVEIHKHDPSIVWTGGGLFLGYPFLQKSTDFGRSWDHLTVSDGHPGSLVSIALDPVNPDIVYTGESGRVLKTNDGGENWNVILKPDDPYTFYCVGLSRDTLIYAGGISQTLHNHRFYKSTDGGLTWTIMLHPELQTKGAQSLFIIEDEDVDILYFGLQEGGVVSYKNLVTSAGDAYKNEIPGVFRLEQNYPNPFNAETVIAFESAVTSHVEITLFDVLGRQFKTVFDGTVNPGIHSVRLSADNLPSGIYYYQMKAGEFIATNTMILQR